MKVRAKAKATTRCAPHCHAHHPPPQAKHLYVLLHPYRRDRTILTQTLCSLATPKSHPFSPWVGCSHAHAPRARARTPARRPSIFPRTPGHPSTFPPPCIAPCGETDRRRMGRRTSFAQTEVPHHKARSSPAFRAYPRLLLPLGPMRVPHTCTPTPDHTN